MKNLWMMTILLLVSAGVFGQGSVMFNGTILDESLNPVFGATVSVNNSRWGGVANEDGNFSISLPRKGSYSYEISYVGYESVKGDVVLGSGDESELIVSLKNAPVKMEELLVSAIKAKNNSPFAHSNMDKLELKSKNVAADLPILLEMTPSLVASSENGTGFGNTSFRIRGTDISRINVTVNGVPLNDGESQAVYWVNMPDFASSVDNIQIQRGVGTSSNGAAAFGASVNFSTLGVESQAYGEVQSMVGSFNSLKNTIVVGTGVLDNGFNLDARYSKVTSDGYIQRGFIDHQSFYGSAGWRNDHTLLKAMAIIGDQETGITWWGVPYESLETDRTFNPAGEYVDDDGNTAYYDGQTDNYKQNHYQLMGNHNFNTKLFLNAAVHLTTGKGYYEQYLSGEDLADYGFTDLVSNSDLIRQKWLDNVFYGYNAAINYNDERVQLSLGTAYTIYDGDHFGEIKWLRNGDQNTDLEWYRNTGTKNDFNIFAKGSYQLIDNLWAFGDLQVRNIQYEMEGPDDDLVLIDQSHNWTFYNPKAGMSFKLDDLRLYGSFAIANREPARADLKESTKEGGNEIPTSERLFDYEAGAIWASRLAVLSTNVYYMSYIDQLVNTGKKNSVGYDIMTNVDNSYRFGIEVGAKFLPTNFLTWDLNATLSRNKIIDYYDDANDRSLGTTDISYSPSLVGSSDIGFKINEELSLHLINKYVGKQYFDNTSSEDRMIDPYHFMNLRFDIDNVQFGLVNLGFQFMVNNLYDYTYSNNAYGGFWMEGNKEMTWKYYFPQAGRNFAVKAIIRF